MVRLKDRSEWDVGQGSFVHSLHRFVFSNVDIVIPMFFISNNQSLKKIWYRVKKDDIPCPCCKGIVPSRGQKIDSHNEGGYRGVPFSTAEFNLYKAANDARLKTLEEKVAEQEMVIEKQRKVIEKYGILADYKNAPQPGSVKGRLLWLERLVAGLPNPPNPAVVVDAENPFKVPKRRKIVMVANPVPPTSIPEEEASHTITQFVQEQQPEEEVPDTITQSVTVGENQLPGPVAGPSTSAGASEWANFGFKQFPKEVVKADTSRQPYSPREDREILKWASNNPRVGGKETWKDLVASGLLPGRTFESLRNRYHRSLKK